MSGIQAYPVEQAVFVYGEFTYKYSALKGLLAARVLGEAGYPVEPPVAIEVLREFGPQEFIGKVYILRETAWRPVTPEAASSFAWYENFQKGQVVSFDMRGSGQWDVEWFRFESSARNPNPYLAVALRRRNPETAGKPSAVPSS